MLVDAGGGFPLFHEVLSTFVEASDESAPSSHGRGRREIEKWLPNATKIQTGQPI